MRFQVGHFPYVGAAHGVLDKVAAPGLPNGLHDLGLGLPAKWILYGKWLLKDGGEDFGKAIQDLRVGGPRRPSTDDLGRNWEIDADHPIFVKANLPKVEDARNNGTQRGVQEGPRALGVFPPQSLLLIDPNGDVKGLLGRIMFFQILQERLLTAVNFWRRSAMKSERR